MRVILATLLVFVSSCALSQTAASGGGSPPASRVGALPANCAQPTSAAQAKHLMEASDTKTLLSKYMSRSGAQMLDTFAKLRPDIPPQVWAGVADYFSSDKFVQGMVDEMAPIYQRHFCAEEVEQLIAFYESPTGRKYTAETPSIQREVGQAISAYTERMKSDIVKSVQEEMSKRGVTFGQAPKAPIASGGSGVSSRPPGSPDVLGVPARPGVIAGIPLGTPHSDLPPQAESGAQAPLPINVSEGVSQGLLVHQVAPVYAALARQARIQGTVVLRALLNKDGSIRSLDLVSGHPMLVPSAMDAVKQWQYKPYYLNGEPVEVLTTINVNFQLQ